MSKSRFYVGVDVGSKELWIAVNGRKPRRFAYTTKGIMALQKWARQVAGDILLHFCMEATGVYSQCLATQLHRQADTEVSIINPAQIKAFAKATMRRTKTDSVDAQVILEFAISQEPRSWSPEPEAIQKLYSLVMQADDIRDNLQQWHNRGHAYSYIEQLPKAVKAAQRAIIRALQRQLDKIEKAISELWQTDQTLKTQVELLCTTLGIAELSAVKLLAYGKSALIERSQKALIAHAGLAPGHRQSGTSVKGRSRIAKQGNKYLRKTLYMPALCGIVHNPVIRQYYQHLRDKGKLKMVALTACMKKLLLIVRAMLIKQKPFDAQINA
jgi:transposase